jgi:hypothetical protein
VDSESRLLSKQLHEPPLLKKSGRAAWLVPVTAPGTKCLPAVTTAFRRRGGLGELQVSKTLPAPAVDCSGKWIERDIRHLGRYSLSAFRTLDSDYLDRLNIKSCKKSNATRCEGTWKI